jgi:uncharacterized radical SAM superfamily Fe-S cluster-containing enzyme
MTEEIIKTTTSICPECMTQIPAEIYIDPKTNWVMMRKNCKDHGEFKDKISIYS